MTRLATEHDLTEIRLRLDVGGGACVHRITREDVRSLLDEIVECWAGNLPEWATDYDGPDCLDDPPAPYVIAKLEILACCAETAARSLPAGSDSAAAWREISEKIFELLEDIDDDDTCRIESQEEACCDANIVLCREARDRACCCRPDPV